MKFWNGFVILLSVLLLFAAVSCKYQRIIRSDDPELKYQKAIEYYEQGEYNRTIRLLTDVITFYRGTAKAEKINYYFAMSHYKIGDYILASHYFKSFVSAYPRSEHAEKFTFLSAYCKYLDSPPYSLDQTNTREAIREFQMFANRFPDSDRVEEVNEYIDELRLKLQKKQFEIARLYYNIGDFRAAVRAFDNLIYDFPGTIYEEKALFYIVKAYHDYASMSIAERQPERYGKTVEAYNRLIRNFPETEYMDEANTLFNNANRVLERYNSKDEVTLTGN